MSIKDRENFYGDLTGTVPNTVSRYVKVGDRSFLTVVAESGKAILDSELQLVQDAGQFANGILNQYQAPSGWLRGQTRRDGYLDYTTVTAPGGFDDATGTHLNVDGTLINAVILPRLVAQVAGMPVVVEYTNTATDGANLVALSAPTLYDGMPLTVKRVDFVFLEVWKALVAPSQPSKGSLVIVSNADIAAGDKITLGGFDLTAVAFAPAVDEFNVGVDADTTALVIATAINDGGGPFASFIKAKAFGPVVVLQAATPGVAGDAITTALTLAVGGCITVSGPHLTGGADRPNKPDQIHLYRHGNVLSPTATWLDDDLVDSVVNQESTQRVQLQYRIRVTDQRHAINYKTHPDAFSASSGGHGRILAWGGTGSDVADYPFVPANRADIWDNSSAPDYAVEDPGLWISGNGTPTSAQDLNAVDGYVYAIPICFVHRHNDVSTTGFGFNPDTNTNGAPLYDHAGYGTIPPGLSDRPDQHFADVIVQDNLLDLRRHVIFPGIDTSSELQYQIQSLLDGSFRTWSVDTQDKQILGAGSGDVSTRFLVCNEIGRSVFHGGIGANTTRGDFIREFDHIARRFADQAVVERVVVAFYPGDRDVANAGSVAFPGLVNDGKFVIKNGVSADKWFNDDILRLDLTKLDGTTLGGLFQGLDGGGGSAPGPLYISDLMPTGTVITDVLSIRHDDGNSAGAIDQTVQPSVILGLGTLCVDIILDQNPLQADGGQGLPAYPLVDTGAGMSGSPRRIFVELEITYPIAEGTTDTVYEVLTPDPTVYDGSADFGPGPVVDEDVTQRPADMEALLAPRFREGYREIQLEYVANDTVAHGPSNTGHPVGNTNTEYLVSTDAHTLYFPRRVYDSRATHVTDLHLVLARTIDNMATEWGSSSRKVVTTDAISLSGQVLCAIQYYPQDAIPNYGQNGYQLGVYFRSHAPQTAGVSDVSPGGVGNVIPTTMRVEPLYMDDKLWTMQVGSASQDRGFPYLAPGDQIPLNDDGAMGTTKEWYFCATADVTLADFNAETGFLSLHAFVQADGQNVFEFGDNAFGKTPRVDGDFRAYYPFARDDVYQPTVISQPLYGAVRHKVMYPFLARATEEVKGGDGGLLFRKNELVLVVMSRTAQLDADNKVVFLDTVDNTTCAAVYRTRNLLLVVGG